MKRLMGDSACKKCKLWESAEHICTMGIGPFDAKVMVIGDMPTMFEAESNEPFISKAGKYIKRNLPLQNVYYTTAVKCTTPDRKTPGTPIITKCKPYLQTEIDVVKPEFVLLLGSAAVKAVFGGKASVLQMRGQFLEKDGAVYFPTISPNSIFYDASLEPGFLSDLEKFSKAVEEGIDDVADNVKYEIITNETHFNLALKDIEGSVIIDIETTGLDPRNDEVTIIGIGTKQVQYILPLQHEESWTYNRPKLQRRLLAKLEKHIADEYIQLANHNIKFDLSFLYIQYGWTIKAHFDTMLAAHSLNENLRNYGLKSLSSDLLGAPHYDISKEEKKGNVSLEILSKYCAYDTYYTRKLYNYYWSLFEEDIQAHVVFSYLYMGASNMLLDVEKRGVYVDESRLLEAIKIMKKQRKELATYLENVALQFYPENINWNSTDQVGRILFNKLKLPVLILTPGGAASVGVNALTELALNGHEVAEKLLEYRTINKLVEDFAGNWVERLKESERLYPKFNLHRTVTGRTSSNDPNLQQVPKDKRIRSLITAPPGKVLIECDLSQIELRIIAMYSQDPTMLEVYRNNGDIHTTTAEAAARKSKEDMTLEEFKDRRSKAKPINFGFMYGMGYRKFVLYAKANYKTVFTENEAKTLRRVYFQTYPNIQTWHDYQKDTAHRKGFVTSPVGRKRRLPHIHSSDTGRAAEAERQAINSPVQSFGSDLLLMAAIEINDRIPEAEIVALIHDAMLIEVNEDIAEEIAERVKKVMENPKMLRKVFKYTLTVPLIAEYALGPWGSK